MKVILAFDSFKGSLTAEEAVTAAKEGILEARPDAEVVALPLADGGEGTAAALACFMDAEWTTCVVHDPLMRKAEAAYAVCKDGKTAIMEMAAAAGLTLLSEEERSPMKTTTYGVGEMMADAIRRGCTHILIGIGGSATNDGGMGMLSALGVRFLDARGERLKPIGGNMTKIAAIDWPEMTDLSQITIDVVCDVQNPLYGIDGAAYVYAPQKGANSEEVELLDRGLRNLACLCRHHQQAECVVEDSPGAGAAGGLGYTLLLLGAKLRRGVDVVLDAADIDRHLHGADLVMTGEGKIDRQTLNGKLPFGVMRRAKAANVPVIALAGLVEDETALLQSGFSAVLSINPPGICCHDAMNATTARHNLRQTARKIIMNK